MALVTYDSLFLHPDIGSEVNLKDLFRHAEGFSQAHGPLLGALQDQPRAGCLELIHHVFLLEVSRLIHTVGLFTDVANDVDVSAVSERLALLGSNLPSKEVKRHLMVYQVVHRLRLIVAECLSVSFALRTVRVIIDLSLLAWTLDAEALAVWHRGERHWVEEPGPELARHLQ